MQRHGNIFVLLPPQRTFKSIVSVRNRATTAPSGLTVVVVTVGGAPPASYALYHLHYETRGGYFVRRDTRADAR